MSEENVALQHRVIDDFNRRDLDAYLALVDPEVEFTPYEVSVQGGDPYRGHAGVRKWWKDSFAVLLEVRAEVYEVRDLGSITLVRGCLRGRGAESRAAFERTMWLVAEWRTRKIVWWGAFASEAEALEAAGLSE